MVITPAKVVAFAKALQEEYHSRYVSKKDAAEMDLAAAFLESIGVQSKALFSKFTTTIGKTIYIPFEIGVETEDYPLWWQIVVLVHEHVHVLQFERGGWFDFGLSYLLDKLDLIRFEGHAYASFFDLEKWRSGRLPELEPHMEPLRYYGTNEDEISSVKEMAHQLGATVALGGHTSPVAEFSVAYLEREMPELKEAA